MTASTTAVPTSRNNGTRPRANVLGVGVDAIDLPTAVTGLIRAAKEGRKGYVCVTGVHGVMESQRDERLREIHNESLLTTPDGMPMVWVGRAQGHRSMDRVYGPSLMLEVCRASVDEGLTHFLYGGAPGVADELARSLAEKAPGIRIAGTYTPPFRPLDEAEERELKDRVEAVRPDFFWVGLSTPKQERFMAEYHGRLPATVFLGVGAAFDFHTGRVPQAPRFVQRSGLEWLFRMLQEPRRLGRRYLRNNPAFLWRLLQQTLRVGKYRREA